MTAPRLVCFDLGGVIVRTCHSWEEGCAAAGIEVRCRSIGEPDPLYVVGVHDELQLGRIDVRTMAQRLCGEVERLYTVEEIMAVHAAWLQGEYRGVAAIIDRLHELSIATAALSNTDADHWAQMHDAYPTFGRLQHKVASHEMGMRKPDPAIFARFVEHTGVDGSEILYFDDLSDNVAAATRAGWRAVQVDPHGEPAEVISRALADHGVDVGTGAGT